MKSILRTLRGGFPGSNKWRLAFSALFIAATAVCALCAAHSSPPKPAITLQSVTSLHVALVAADRSDWINDVQTKLIATGKFSQVDIINAGATTPTLAQLQAYDSVLVWNDSPFSNGTVLGNNVADYVDAGGGVVIAVFADASEPLGGRFRTQDYYALEPLNQNAGGGLTLGTIHEPASPLLAGVTSFNGGTSSFRSTGSPNAHAVRVADYSDGEPLIVRRVINGVHRVDLNFFPPSDASRSDFWKANTDGAKIMANALVFTAISKCVSPPAGLISWWPADNTGADIASDNDLSLGGATFASGKVGQAFSFNGSSIASPGTPSGLVITGTNVTIDGWIYPTVAPSGFIVLFGRANSGGHDYALILNTDLTGVIKTANGDPGLEHFVHTGFNPPLNTWTHVALTYDGSTITVYANGVAVASESKTGNISDSGGPFELAGQAGCGSCFFAGLIDEVEVFNTTLTAGEVQAIFFADTIGKCRSCYGPPSDMVGWWPGDGNTKDIQGGNNGLLKNGATFATGEVGQAFSFNGGNAQEVDVPHDDNQNTGAQITLDAWILPSSGLESGSNAHASIINKRTPGNVQGYTFEIDNENTTNGLRFEITTNNGGFGMLVPNATVADVWQHVAATYDGSTMTIYVNGVSVGTPVPATGTINAVTNDLIIGRNIFNGQSFPGSIDEVEIFNRALGGGEIEAIYNAGSQGKCKPTCVSPPSGLISWWPGDNTATDIQGGNNGALQAGATFGNGKVDRSFSFDGISGSVNVPKSPSLDVGNQVTVDFWMDGSASNTFSGSEGLVVTDFYGVETEGSTLAFYISTNSGGSFVVASTSVPATGQWHHVAGTYDGSEVKLYVDGVLQSSLAESGSISPMEANSFLTIGSEDGRSFCGASCVGNRYFGGRIDEVELFNRALTPDEVLALYNAGSAGKCKTVRFYVSNNANNTIEKFDINGIDLGTFADSSVAIGSPTGVAFDFSGNLYVVNDNNGTIRKYDPLGNQSFFSGQLSNGAFGLAFDFNGNLYLADYNGHVVRKYDPSANMSIFASGISGLSDPVGLAFDTAGNLFVSDYIGNKIFKYVAAENGSVFGSENSPTGLAFDVSGELFAADINDSTIEKLDSAGNGTPFASGLNAPFGLAFDLNGNLYAANSENSIEKFDSSGNGTLFASAPTSNLNTPEFIAVQLLSPTAACIQFDKPSYSVNEGTGSVTLTVTRNGDVSGSSTVHYQTFDGTSASPAIAPGDYTSRSGDLNFGSTETSKPIPVQIIDNDDSNPGSEPPSKEFTVTLSNATDAMLSGPATVTVTIIDIHHDVTTGVYQNAGGGTVSGGGTFDQGKTITLTATPADSCHSFVEWVDGSGSFVSSDNPYSFTLNNDVSVFAVFSLNSYNISVSASPSTGGSVSGGGSYDCGSQVDLVATANDCYAFTNWTEGNSVASTSASYSFTAASDRTLVANFTLKEGCTGACVSAFAGTIQNVSSEYPGREAVHAVDGSGLDANNPPNHDTDPTHMWMSHGDGSFSAGTPDPDLPGQLAHITFNLGGTFGVNSFRVWNYNEFTNAHNFSNRGIKDLTISVSIDGTNFTPVINPATNTTLWTLAQAPGSSTYTGQLLTFSTPLTAAYIRFDIKSNFGADPSDNVDRKFVGLSEIRFDACPVSCVPPPARMIAWWKGDGNANDAVGGQDGSLMGNATFATGEVGQGFSFDGVAGHVSVPSPTGNFGTSDFTIDFWMRTTATDNREIVNKRLCGDGNHHAFEARLVNGGIFFELLRNDDATGSNLSSTRTYNDGQFHHIVLLRSGNTMSIYGDGTLDISTTDPNVGATNINNPQPFGIGGGGCGAPSGDGTKTFQGVIDEVEMFDRALSADEIAGIVRAGGLGKCECTPPPANLISWWPGEGDANDVQSGNNGTLQGNATFSAGEVGQAFSFDGNGDAVVVGNPANLQVQTFTIDAWIKRASTTAVTQDPGSVTGDGEIFVYGSGGYGLSLHSDGRLSLTKTGTSFVDSPGVSVTDTSFHHIAVTKTGSTVVFYVDGVASTAPAYDPGFTFTTNAAIGAEGDNLGGSFWGTIDEVEIFGRALDAPEIAAIYHAGSAGKCRSCVTAPTPGMVSWWPGDNNANDIQGSNNGTLQGGATFGVGEVNQAFSFNGTSAHIQIPDSPALNPTNQITIDAWVKTSTNARQALVSKFNQSFSSPNGSYDLAILNNSLLEFRLDNVGYLQVPAAVCDGQWHHIAGTCDGATIFCYVDGVLAASTTGSGGNITASTLPLYLGAELRDNADSGFLNGQLDEVEIFNRALSQSEIQSIYDAGSSGKCKPTVPAQRQLANISSRADVGTGDNVAIAGFIIQTDPVVTSQVRTAPGATKHVLIRGLGPSLTGIGSPTLADPVLDLYNSQGTKIDHNDNWMEEPDGTNNPTRTANIQATGLAPTNPNEAALLETLSSNSAYTAILSGKSGSTGIGLVEVYDLEAATNTHLHNLSTRAFVSTGDNVLIGGLIVQGDATTRIVLRAIGPSLAGSNISNPLPDPVLDLHDANGTIIESNNDWGSSPEAAAISASGLAPTNPKESAILFAPAPGPYTAIMRDRNGNSGVGSIEAYWLGP